jgi:hypothetical protein
MDDEANGQATEQPEATPCEAPAAPDNHDAATLAKIVALNRDVSDARFEWERLHERTKAAKAVLEERQSRLNDYIAEIGREYPLFDGPKAPAPEVDDDAWRAESIRGLTLSVPLVGKILEAGIETVGALCDYRKDGRGFTDIKGVGDAAATKIEDALEAFFAARRPVVDVNAELVAGVREAEAGRAEPAWPSDAPDAWRAFPVRGLALADDTLMVLVEQDVATVGELVALGGARTPWLSADLRADVANGLEGIRSRLSDAQFADLDAARDGRPAAAPEPKPGRRKKVGA